MINDLRQFISQVEELLRRLCEGRLGQRLELRPEAVIQGLVRGRFTANSKYAKENSP